MAMEIGKADVWAGEIDDRAGGLARVLESLAGAGADLEFVIGRRRAEKPGAGVVFVCPVRGKKAQDAARNAGLKAADVPTLRVVGADKPGLGGRMMRAIAEQGINVRGLSGAVVNGKFVAYFGFDSADDAARAAKALKATANGKGAAKKRAHAMA